MRVCKTIRQESLCMFYGENIFDMEIYLGDPAMEPPSEVHQRLKFLRSIKLLIQYAHFQYMKEVVILATLYRYEDAPEEKEVMGLAVRILQDQPLVIPLEEADEWGIEEAHPVLRDVDIYFEYPELDPTDWGDNEPVHQAVETQLEHYGYLYHLEGFDDVNLLLDKPRVGRLCEVLSLLLGQSSVERHVFTWVSAHSLIGHEINSSTASMTNIT